MALPLLVIALLVQAGSIVIGELFRPIFRGQRGPTPGMGDINVPTAQEGRPVPVGWGVFKVAGGNIVWDGDLETRPVKRKVPSNGFFGSGPKHSWGPDVMFYLGIDIGLCIGPIDEVLDIQFEDRTVDAGAQVTVVEGRNSVVFANTPLGSGDWLTADIPAGVYPNNAELGYATSQAMTALDDGTWKVLYGYHMLPGFSAKIRYSVTIAGVSTILEADVTGVYLTGKDAATALAVALNGSERLQDGGARVAFTGDYDERTGFFHLSFVSLRGGVTAVYLRGIVDYGVTALANYGFILGTDHLITATSGEFVSAAETRAENFTFAFGGTGGEIDRGNPAFTAMGLFGISPPIPTGVGWGAPGDGATPLPYMGTGARPSPAFMSITDLGNTARAVINAPDLFGGLDADGGVVGTIDICKGASDQLPNDYLEAVMAQDLPGYRNICHAVGRHTYLGKSPYIKPPAFVLGRRPNQLGLSGGHENINGDANPACMIYEIMTQGWDVGPEEKPWGCGINPARIDADSFIAGGDTLFSEGLGLSMLHDTAATGEDLIAEICRYIEGIVVRDAVTLKYRLVLARADYDIETLPVLDPSTIDSLTITRPSWAQLKNMTRLTFVDRSKNFTDRTVMEIDPAGVVARGGERAIEDLEYRAISNVALAQQVNARALKILSYPLAILDIVPNHKASGLRPGDVFALTWPDEGITKMPCRLMGIRLGDDGTEQLHIDATEDIYGVAGTSFSDPGGSDWIDPSTLPQPFSLERLVEAPYAIATTRRVMTLASPGAKAVDGYQVWSDPAGGSVYTQTQDVKQLTPRVQLAQRVGPGDTALVIQGLDAPTLTGTDDPGFAAGANLVLVDDEWIAWRNIADNGDGTFTLSRIARGCIDSAPRDHAAGADAWATSLGYGFTQDDAYSGDGVVSAKLLGYIGADVMAIATALRLSLELASRASRPYCPCGLSINRQSYPANIVGDLVIAWTPRDRTDTWSYADAGATAARETGTHERVRIYGEDDTLIHTEEPLTDPSFVYTVAAEMADTGLARPSTRLRIVVDALDGADLESRDQLEWTVRRGSDVGSDTDTGNKVKVTSADTTPGYLTDKIAAGSNVVLTTLNPGDNEQLEISVPTSPGSPGAPVGVIYLLPMDWAGENGSTTTLSSGSETLPVRNFPQLDDRTDATTFQVPNDWTALSSIVLSYCNRGTSTNPFVMRVGLRILAAGGDSTAAPTFGANVTITPPATQDQKATVSLSLPAGVTPAPGDEVIVVLQRKPGATGTDTNTSAMSLISLAINYT